MKFCNVLFLALGASASLALLGCSSSDDSSPSNNGGTGSGGGSSITPQSHGENESCPDGVSDCAAGLLCDAEDPNGQCYKTCTPGMDSECGDPSLVACNHEGHCYPRCTQTSDCARASEGYICQDDSPPRPPVKFCDGP
jgi:hypothetical protein